jgi:ubiquinone biosynthesis protein
MSRIGLGQTLRNTRRVRAILGVLIRHGFADVAEELGVVRVLARLRRRLLRSAPSIEPVPEAVRVRRVLEELGPTFVKLGQVMSTRPDLVPPEWAKELENLQSEARPVPWPAIEQALRREFGDRLETLFASIEHEPIGSASVAQVHRAVLAGGEPVAVKILRPGIHETIEADIAIMRGLAALLERRLDNLGYSPTAVVEQFARELLRETDLAIEGRSTERMARAFAQNPHVHFPRVYQGASTRNVLTLEAIDGLLLSRLQPEDLDTEQRLRVVQRCADLVFEQCLEIGFFHADPHAGNIFILPGEVVCFVDCGMTGKIEPAASAQIADLVRGVLARDLELVVRTAVAVAQADPALAEDRGFRADVWAFIDEFDRLTLAELQIGRLLRELFGVLQRHRIRCAADLIHLIKAIVTLEAVCADLAPQFDLAMYARPRIEALLRRRYGIRAMRRRLEHAATGYAEVFEELPHRLRDVFERLRRGHPTVGVDHRGLEEIRATLHAASLNVAYALLVAALIVASALLLLADSVDGEYSWIATLALIGFLSSAGIALLRMLRLWLGGY